MKKISLTQSILTTLYVVCFVISNILAAKQYIFIGDIALNCGTLTFPITYILSDIFSEVYGYKWSRLSWFTAAAACLFTVIFTEIAIIMPYPEFWGNQEAFASVLGSTPRTLFASMVAFGIGDYLNDKVFKKLKERHSGELKGFGFRAIISSLIGEFFDSLVFFPLAFYGIVPVETMILTGIALVFMKVGYECLIFPLTRLLAKKLIKHENSANNVQTAA